MDLHFFETMPTYQKLAWIFICLSVFWIMENWQPFRKFNYQKWKHAKVNFALLTSSVVINAIFGLLSAGIILWVNTSKFGLLNVVELPVWLKLILSIMLLDFMAQYVVHYLLHNIPLMWRFHMIHHSDTHVDVTTGTRHHPIDYIFRELFSLISIVLFGMPFVYYIVYRIITVFFTYFSHANINLPSSIDRGLSYIFITPQTHKFHHHYQAPWTDSNYGNIFSIWDRIFGTFVYDNTEKIKYGVDILPDEKSNDLGFQLKAPFNRIVQ